MLILLYILYIIFEKRCGTAGKGKIEHETCLKVSRKIIVHSLKLLPVSDYRGDNKRETADSRSTNIFVS